MNSDIRLQVTFFGHPKTKKLERKLGAEGVLCLLRLWVWAAQNKPDGILSRQDHEDIAIAAEWDGDEDEFIATLVALRLLDQREDGCLTIHGWAERNTYASTAEGRSIANAKNAAFRHAIKNIPKKEHKKFRLWYEKFRVPDRGSVNPSPLGDGWVRWYNPP